MRGERQRSMSWSTGKNQAGALASSGQGGAKLSRLVGHVLRSKPLCFFLFVVVCVVPLPAWAAATRLGLVIGEARYAAGALQTPANDAGAVAQSLAASGFEVTGYADLDREGIRRALSGFLDKARQAGPDAVAFVYLAGHGVQFDGANFVVPVEARLARDIDVPGEAVSLADFTRDLAAVPLKARVLVCDLARPNAFPGGSGLASGLVSVAPPAGTTVAFNAAPGAVADEGGGDYSLYVQALTEAMQTKGLSAETLFTRLRLRVAVLSGGREVPWSDGATETALTLVPPLAEAASLLDPLKSMVAGRTASEAYWLAVKQDTLPAYRDFLKAYPGDPLDARVGSLLAARREASIWAQARRANVAPAYWTYMRFYPRGPHFADARRSLAALPAALEPPPRFDVYAFPDLPAPRPDELALLKRIGTEAGPASMPAAVDLPPRRAEFFERLPPLLAVAPGTLPLAVPIPSGALAEGGRILQPGATPNDQLVVASDVVDRTGNVTVVQTGGEGRVLSSASVTPEPNGARSLVQTGPDGQAVATVLDRVEPNGRRTVTQTGRDKQVISRSVVEPTAGGGRSVVLSGPQGVAAGMTIDASGILGRSPPPSGATAGVLLRPTILAVPAARPQARGADIAEADAAPAQADGRRYHAAPEPE